MKKHTWKCGSLIRARNRFICDVSFYSLLHIFFFFAATKIKGINITALIVVQSSVCIMNGRDENDLTMNTHTHKHMCLSTNRPKTFSMSDFSNGSVSITIAQVCCDVLIFFPVAFFVVVEIVVPLIDHCEIANWPIGKIVYLWQKFIRKFRNLFHISHRNLCAKRWK